MKKLIAGLMLSSCVLGLAMPAFAQDGTEADLQEDYSGVDSANVEVNGTLGADNTDPGATIPEGDPNWINVTVPTKTIFYNTAADSDIKSPTYDIVNNSGRPVKVSISNFVDGAGNSSLGLTSLDFDLNVTLNGTETLVVNQGVVKDFSTPAQIVELPNSKGQSLAADTPVENPTTNKTTFTYTGTATAATQVQPTYTMTLKFDAVSWN
ncbi:hypothetical protein RU97_GL001908 [Enterococcus canis]|uniref:WxL domain-containing protein n=1 Tax=Enterococcus canis TaxID=214095 RepID=A0A1L8RFF2_9ENTE|nr:hypothetical protein [Enterococcus canis]OJG18511.1 hypothetical protein RU97_GL001908 [Enterococcus canis]